MVMLLFTYYLKLLLSVRENWGVGYDGKANTPQPPIIQQQG